MCRTIYANMMVGAPDPYLSQDTPTEDFVNHQVGWEPGNIRQAQAHPTWPVWKAAMDKEVKGLLGRGTWTEIHRSQVQANVKIMGSQFIFKDKVN